MGERCEIREYDGKTREGKACEREAIGRDGKGRLCCARHLRKLPDHVRERRDREAGSGPGGV